MCVLFVTMSSFQIEKMYVQRQSEQGWVFYIFEQKMNSIDKQSPSKNIVYDYTYVEDKDSVSMLSTIVLRDVARPMKVVIATERGIYDFEPEQIYVNTKGDKMVYRLKIGMPFNVWEKIYYSSTPFKLTYEFEREKDGLPLCFNFSNKKEWGSLRENMQKILGLIKLNIKN